MSRRSLERWCAACWTGLRNGFGGASMRLAILAQLPALEDQGQPAAAMTGEQP